MTLTFAGWDREGDGDPGEATKGHQQTEGWGQEHPRADGPTRGHAKVSTGELGCWWLQGRGFPRWRLKRDCLKRWKLCSKKSQRIWDSNSVENRKHLKIQIMLTEIQRLSLCYHVVRRKHMHDKNKTTFKELYI